MSRDLHGAQAGGGVVVRTGLPVPVQSHQAPFFEMAHGAAPNELSQLRHRDGGHHPARPGLLYRFRRASALIRVASIPSVAGARSSRRRDPRPDDVPPHHHRDLYARSLRLGQVGARRRTVRGRFHPVGGPINASPLSFRRMRRYAADMRRSQCVWLGRRTSSAKFSCFSIPSRPQDARTPVPRRLRLEQLATVVSGSRTERLTAA